MGAWEQSYRRNWDGGPGNNATGETGVGAWEQCYREARLYTEHNIPLYSCFRIIPIQASTPAIMLVAICSLNYIGLEQSK